MGPYVFVNAALVGFFAFAAVLSGWCWLRLRRAPVLIVFAGHCLVCAAVTTCLVVISTADSLVQAQLGFAGRSIFGLLSVVTTIWLVCQVSGVAARRFAILVTLFFTGVAVYAAVHVPFNHSVTEIDILTLPWGEQIALLVRRPAPWWVAPVYGVLLAVNLFGFFAGWQLARRDRRCGAFMMLASLGGVGSGFGAMAVDVAQWPWPYWSSFPHAAWVGVIALLLSRMHRQREAELAAAEAQVPATRRKLAAQLRDSQKMQALGLLAGGVAHDFNNLLTVVAGYADLMLAKLPTEHAFVEPINAIKHAGDVAAALTRQLLVFSRQNVYDPKIIDLNTLVRDTQKMLCRVIGEDIHFTVDLDPAIGAVKADPTQLGQVLLNLAVNARDAMPRGGTLTITTSSVGGECGIDRIVKLCVTDTGVGIDPEHLPRIFEPFFTTKGVGKGTGLGLAVVHGIIEQSGGCIDVDSTLGLGTTFTILLPACGPLPAPTPAPIRQEEAESGSETILLVEDEDVVRRLAIAVLEGHGYHVLAAADGREAVSLAEEHALEIDLLLTDVVMPQLNGFEVAQALQTRFPKIKVLFMTGYSGDCITQRGLRHDDIHLLPKPYTPRQLAGKVREVLDEAEHLPKPHFMPPPGDSHAGVQPIEQTATRRPSRSAASA